MAEQMRWSMGLEHPPSSTNEHTADLGDIVVFVDGQSETTGILEFAGVLAQEHGAHLIAVFMQPEPVLTPPETFAQGKGIREVMDAHEAQLKQIEADHRTFFDHVVRRHEVRPEWRSVSYFSSDVGGHAHYADLAVVARPDPAGLTASPPGLIESLVLTSGRPIIIFRHTARSRGSAASSWDGTPVARPFGPWQTPGHYLPGPTRSRFWSSTISVMQVMARSREQTSRAT